MHLHEICQALDVSRSGLHAHHHKASGQRRLQDDLIARELHDAFAASRQTYGSPRLVHALRRKGLRHGKNRIARLMRREGLQVRQKRRYIPRTTFSDKGALASPNLLQYRQLPDQLNEVWLTDITYIPTHEGWLYLAAEMDLCSRRIVGWNTLESLHSQLPTVALERALQTRDLSMNALVHHSDRGCQYTSDQFRRCLETWDITQSMSRQGNCYDNAAMESFWATLKAECFASQLPATRTKARSMIFDYIETFYNPVRLHSALGYQSPVDFENTIKNN